MTQTSPTKKARRRLRIGWGFVVLSGAAMLLSYLVFPESDAFGIESAGQLHRSMGIAGAALALAVIGGCIISYEVTRRYDERIRHESPVDIEAYRAHLRAMLRRADRYPTDPVCTEDVDMLVKLAGPFAGAHSATGTSQ